MCVTITISNNHSYVDANCPELIELEAWDEELGMGMGVSKFYPNELELANGNFYKVFTALGIYPGLDADQCGSVKPSILLEKLKPSVVKRLVCKEQAGGNYIECGITLEQASRYFWNLTKLAVEAQRRNEIVVWY